MRAVGIWVSMGGHDAGWAFWCGILARVVLRWPQSWDVFLEGVLCRVNFVLSRPVLD